MNLEELKLIIDDTIGHELYKKPKEIPILINLSEPSVGARAGCSIAHANLGFDWEHGQFRLSPSIPLVRKGNSLSDIKPYFCEKVDGRNYYWCSRCENRVSKTDRYCRSCGQRMK